MPAMLKIVATNNDSTLVEPAAALKVVEPLEVHLKRTLSAR